MHSNDTPLRSEFASAHDNALKSLRAIFLLTGRSPEEALQAAAGVIVTLLEHGGTGWIERLIEGQSPAQLRMMARFAARDMALHEVDARTRAQALVVCLARQAMATEVFDAVAARAH